MKQDFSAMGRKGARKSAITRKRLKRLVTRKQRWQMKNLVAPDLSRLTELLAAIECAEKTK